MNIIQKNWILRSNEAAPAAISEWAAELGISNWLVTILWLRGLTTIEDMKLYLSPGLRNLVPPLKWPGVELAASIIVNELLAGKKLAVWGDYDVDGVTSTALVKTTLDWHGFSAAHFLPHRSRDGYGLNKKGVQQLADEGIGILLTVDCGISDHEPIELARELDLTVIISDHHLPGETLPRAHAICNPALPDSPYSYLAGVGMAFFLMAQVNNLLKPHTGQDKDIREVLDFVALGTLADMVPLTGQNRILVKNGLLLLNEAKRPGISALKAVAGYAPSANLGAGQVSFALAPRINAAGRLDHADDALKLLMSTSSYEAQALAEKLDQMNKDRRQQEELIFKEAFAQAEAAAAQPALILFEPHWHPGIIGIVASRMVEAFYKPTIVLCEDEGVLKGSARSIKELNIHSAITACAPLLLRFGGHHQAAGLSLNPDILPQFRQTFCEAVVADIGEAPVQPTLFYDLEAGFDIASSGTHLKELEMIQPFGIKNSEPVFTSPPLLLKSVNTFGMGHVKLELHDEAANVTLRIKAWRLAQSFPATGVGRYLKIAYSARLDNYNGVPSVDINMRDWRWLV